jgi:hypothetical protein
LISSDPGSTLAIALVAGGGLASVVAPVDPVELVELVRVHPNATTPNEVATAMTMDPR